MEANKIKTRKRKLAPLDLDQSGGNFETRITATNPSQQQNICKITKYPTSNRKQKVFEKLLLEFIVLDSVPFSTVERKGFQNLIGHLDEMITIPHRTTVSRRLVEEHQLVRFNSHKIMKHMISCDFF